MVAEFQAVVLAYGRTSPLEELITTPKPLLQIGNFPLIYYPLQWLSKNGFSQAIVVVSESTEKDIFTALAPYFENEMTLEFVSFAEEEDFGTADALRRLYKKQKLKEVASRYRMHDASLMVVYQKALPSDLLIPGAKTKKHHDREIVLLEPSSQRVILSTSEADVEETLEIPRYLLMRYPRLRVRTALQDAHIYLIKKWVLDYLVAEPTISSVRSELIPKIIRKQHRSKRHKSIQWPALSHQQHPHRQTPSEMTNNPQGELLDRIAAEDELELLAREMSVWSDHQGDMADTYFGNSIRCYAYLAEDNFCMRVNTVAAYCEANRQVPRILQALLPQTSTLTFVHPSVTFQGKTQVGADSMVGEGTTVGDKASIKKSVIGRNCRISDKAKIINSVLMDDVTIGENGIVQGSVVCTGAVLGEKCELKDCLVGLRYDIPADCKFTSDTLTDGDQLMEY